MITPELKAEIYNHFTPTYIELLQKHIYKDENMVRALFKGKEVKAAYEELVMAYFDALTDFYQMWPEGSYLNELEHVKKDERLKNALKVYLDYTGDETLIRFLQVYSYCVQEPSSLIYDKDYNICKDTVESYFAQTHANSLAMFSKFEKDIKEGNYWWLKNSATTLRRQLFEDIIVLSEKRFVYLCDTYFDRKVDIRKEFINAVNGGEKLIPELDVAMQKNHHAKPYYCWWEYREDGKRILHMDENQPANGVYTYVAYHHRKDNRAVAKDNYYL